MSDDRLLPPAGGYPKLKTFRLAQLINDMTVLFCDRYVNVRSRNHDQMAQAARSGSRNIAEGSVDSATSKKIELKLTNVSRGSLEELRLDYEDYLRHRGLPILDPRNPALMRFKARRCATLEEVRQWVKEEHARSEKEAAPLSSDALAANAALSLINICSYLLKRQIDAQAQAFEEQGGITERLYHRRRRRRDDT